MSDITTIGSAIVADLRARIEAARTFGHQAVLTPTDSIEIVLDGYERMRAAIESGRVYSGYDDDEVWFPLFSTLEAAKAYGAYAYGESGADQATEFHWRERTEVTEHVGFPDSWRLEADGCDTDYTVCGLPTFGSAAAAIEHARTEQEREERERAERRAAFAEEVA